MLRTPEFWVYHSPPDEHGKATLGHLFIESDRHAPYLDDLTDGEAESPANQAGWGGAPWTGAHFVFAAVIGTGEAHFHEHLICRFADTPAGVAWHESAQAAPRVDSRAVASFASRIRGRVAD